MRSYSKKDIKAQFIEYINNILAENVVKGKPVARFASIQDLRGDFVQTGLSFNFGYEWRKDLYCNAPISYILVNGIS